MDRRVHCCAGAPCPSVYLCMNVGAFMYVYVCIQAFTDRFGICCRAAAQHYVVPRISDGCVLNAVRCRVLWSNLMELDMSPYIRVADARAAALHAKTIMIGGMKLFLAHPIVFSRAR